VIPLWDLAIVGGGPAGTAAALGALAARPDLRVVLLDRATFPRDKSCGDGIAPQVIDVLAAVGVTGLVEDRVPIRTLELTRGTAAVSRAMSRPAWVVPRALFDDRLVSAAVKAGAELQHHRVRAVRVGADSVDLDDLVTARVVVGADGAQSLLRGVSGAEPVRRRALALRGYAPTPPARIGKQTITFGAGRQPSYAWSFDRGDGFANVGYGELVTGDHRLTRTLLQQRLETLLPGATAQSGDWLGHHLPLSSWRWQQPDGRVLLAGDAAGLVNPMTGEGIYYAVATGVLAGRAAVSSLAAGDPQSAGRRHRVAVRALLSRHLRHTALGSRLLSRPAFVTAGIRAAARDQGVFDDLVEIGLAHGLATRRVVRGLAAGLVPRASTP
jgi:geranylgeranyl reductase family protein